MPGRSPRTEKPAPAAPPAERLHRGRTLEQRRAERRRALLDAALELIGTNGYDATTIRQVCGLSFVTSRYLYEEFGSLEGLLVALYDDLMRSLADRLLAIPPSEGPDDAARVARERFSLVAHGIVDDERVARIILLESGNGSESLAHKRRESHEVFAAFINDLSLRYEAAGTIRSGPDYRLLALGWVGAVVEVLTDWVLGAAAERPPVDEVVDGFVEIFMLVRRGLER